LWCEEKVKILQGQVPRTSKTCLTCVYRKRSTTVKQNHYVTYVL